MSEVDRLRYYDDAWKDFVDLRDRLVGGLRMASLDTLSSKQVRIATEKLPNQLCERLISELNEWLPATIVRLHVEVRMGIVADAVAEARATLAELAE